MLETIIMIAIAISIFAFGVGLGAYLENVRLAAIHAEEALIDRITQEFEVQNEHIWAAAAANKQNCPSSREEGQWDAGITQELPVITDGYPQE